MRRPRTVLAAEQLDHPACDGRREQGRCDGWIAVSAALFAALFNQLLAALQPLRSPRL
jgi:hypothetical protein